MGATNPRACWRTVLVDKLSAIVGYCELGRADAPQGTESAKRFEMIHDMANKMATELSQHQCHLSGLVHMEAQNHFLT